MLKFNMSTGKLASRTRAAVLLASATVCMGASGLCHAQAVDLSQGAAYHPVPGVAKGQAQLVVMRKSLPPGDPAARQGAHVYIDGSLNTALLPGTYTRFCVAPGQHNIEAYVGDEPFFAGKAHPRTQVELKGGNTYFVAVSDGGAGELVPYGREKMEPMLADMRELRFVVNRAQAVMPCEPEAERTIYTLKSDVLFDFARGDSAAITAEGRAEIGRLGAEIREKAAEGPLNISVRGHADPIGRASSNLVLSRERAQSVRRVLVSSGVSSEWIRAEGVGSREPVTDCGAGPATRSRIECNAPNRRVEVIVQPAVER